MIINPGRETFVHFPSAVLGNKYTMSVFLPENAVPLSRYYPVVYLLGAGPKQAREAQAFLETNKAVVVGINFEEADYNDGAKIVQFISRELVPYIDTNYLTLTRPENRVIAARGKGAAVVAMELFAKPNLFGGLSLASVADAAEHIKLPSSSARVFVTGTQAELAHAQQKLEAAGLSYGTGFALAYADRTAGWFDALPLDYFFAPADKAVLRRFSEKASDEDSTIIRLPQLEISLENYQVKAAGKIIPCTPKEVEILHMLCSNVGQVFSREQILSRVWGYDYFGDTRTVDAHIKRIRQKLPQENVPWTLKTVYGVGYRFEVNA